MLLNVTARTWGRPNLIALFLIFGFMSPASAATWSVLAKEQ
jgi:hypothetical protein